MNLTIEKEADVLRIALSCAVSSREEVIRWADDIIGATEEPEFEIIEISTSGNAHIQDLIGRLSSTSHQCNHYASLRTVLGRMCELARTKGFELRSFTRGLEHFSIDQNYELPDDLKFFNGLDDGLYLAEEGIYGDLDTYRKEFMSELKRYWSEQSTSSNWYSAAATHQ